MGGISETTPYVGGERQAVPASTPYMDISRWGKAGLSEATPRVGGARQIFSKDANSLAQSVHLAKDTASLWGTRRPTMLRFLIL